MNEKLKRIIDLQASDHVIAGLRKELGAIPIRLEGFRKHLTEAQRVVAEMKTTLETMSKERRTAERDLEAFEAKISKFTDQQMLVKTNKEYQTLLHEVETLKKQKGGYEDTILAIMEKGAEYEKKIKEQERELKAEEAVFETEEKKLKAESARLEGQLVVAEAERDALARGVEPEHLRNYLRLMTFQKGSAVAAVMDGICQGCHVALPPQKYQEVKRNNDIITCNQCKRIIYYQEGSPAGAASESEKGGAS